MVSIPARHAGDLGSIPSGGVFCLAPDDTIAQRTHVRDPREIRTPNLLIWSQTRYRCAMPPLFVYAGRDVTVKTICKSEP